MAYKFNEKFAAKVNFGWLKGTDWTANNYDGKPGTGATRASLDYDGYNVYGDLVAANLNVLAGGTLVSLVQETQSTKVVIDITLMDSHNNNIK